MEDGDDPVLEHSKALLFELLLIAVNHDVVREGDGEGILRMWRYQMVQFWNKNHYKYAIAGHMLLASKLHHQCLLINLLKISIKHDIQLITLNLET